MLSLKMICSPYSYTSENSLRMSLLMEDSWRKFVAIAYNEVISKVIKQLLAKNVLLFIVFQVGLSVMHNKHYLIYTSLGNPILVYTE